jgi:hypothetical protein
MQVLRMDALAASDVFTEGLDLKVPLQDLVRQTAQARKVS